VPALASLATPLEDRRASSLVVSLESGFKEEGDVGDASPTNLQALLKSFKAIKLIQKYINNIRKNSLFYVSFRLMT